MIGSQLTKPPIPPVSAFKPGIRASGFNILVGLPFKETVTEGGIILPDTVSDRDRLGEVRGRIVSMSPACFDFAAFPESEKPKVGDAIIFARHSGIVTEGEDGKEMRLILDKDVCGVIEEEV